MEDNKKLLVGLLGLAVLLLLVNIFGTYNLYAKFNAAISGLKQNSASDQSNAQNQQASAKIDVSAGDSPFLGQANAPVTIIEFSDFQCPYCGNFTKDAFLQIKSQYIQGGKVKFVFRNFPLPFHENAEKAAEAALCANEQGKFWDYHDKLFANQNALTVDNLKTYAKDLGLDTSKFNSCLDSGTMEATAKKDAADGTSYGVGGTPSFFITKGSLSVDPNYIIKQSQANQLIIDLGNNDTVIIGAQPFSEFQKAIEKELTK